MDGSEVFKPKIGLPVSRLLMLKAGFEIIDPAYTPFDFFFSRFFTFFSPGAALFDFSL